MANIKITTGTYNCSDYKIVKHYSSVKPALKFLKSIKYPNSELLPHFNWSYQGINYTLSVV